MPPKQRPNRVPLPRQSRRPSTRLLVGLVAAAVIVTGGAIVLSLTLGGGHKTAALPTVAANGLGIVAGIPQNGLVLGNPNAKVTLTEYIDATCPICKDYVLTTFPSIIKTYVRPGKVKIEARVFNLGRPSSSRGRELLLAAARQNRAWQLVDLMYHNQGDEGTAWLTDDLARVLAAKVPGLNIDTLFTDSTSNGVLIEAAALNADAQSDGVTATPTFVLTTPDGKRHLLGAGDPGFAAFAKVLNRALAG